MTTVHHAPPRNGAYVDAGGVATYYEVTGDGPPVVLLHGGLCSAETLDAQTHALAERHAVYVPERYAHGRTADVEGPLTYERLAAHTLAFMEAVGLGSADIVGWSDGALVGLLVALRRPTLVRRLVFLEQFVRQADARPELLELLTHPIEESVPPFLLDLYRALSPDGPDHLPVVLDKLHALWAGETGVDLDDLAHVRAPTLIVLADGGCVDPPAAETMRRSFPDAQLAVVPGTTHALPFEKPDLLNQLILDFLDPKEPT